jgi:mevalonate kinase
MLTSLNTVKLLIDTAFVSEGGLHDNPSGLDNTIATYGSCN